MRARSGQPWRPTCEHALHWRRAPGPPYTPIHLTPHVPHSPFLTLPVAVVESLRVGAARRAARARRAGVDDDADAASDADDDTVLDVDADDGDDGGGEDADWRGLLQASMAKTAGAAYVDAPPAAAAVAGAPRSRAAADGGAARKADAARSPTAVLASRASRRGSASSVGSGRASAAPRIRFPLRPHRDTGHSLVRLVTRFAVPLLVLLVFFGVKYAVTARQVDSAVLSASVAVAAAYRATSVREVVVRVRRTLMTVGPPNSTLVLSRVGSAFALIDNADFDNNFLLFGQPAYDSLVARANDAIDSPGAVASDVRSAMIDGYFVDGCAYVARADPSVREFAQPFNATACAALSDGVVARGLFSAHTQFSNTARSLIQLRAGATINAAGIGVDAAGKPVNLTVLMPSAALNDFYSVRVAYSPFVCVGVWCVLL